ncbi:MAG: 4'-phosphopantetheinyl transferase [Glaciecola sp.]|jgi:4'-phosphopantetheinyl transferase
MSLSILPNEIHLWFVYSEQIQDSELLASYRNIISLTEARKNSRFLFEKGRQQHLITRALVRSVLSEYIGSVSPGEWEFTQNEYGKPEVLPVMLPFPLKFNLSHAKSMIVLAVSNGQEVGVDVESVDRDIASDKLANYAFSKKEYEQLKQVEAAFFQERFFDFWTFKEAYIKACGMGLSIPLDSFSFIFSETNKNMNKVSIKFEKERRDDPKYWKFWQIKPCKKFTVSLALKSNVAKSAYKISMHNIVPLVEYSLEAYPFTMSS